MTSGAAQLREWIRRSERTQAETAELFGITESYVSMLVNRKSTPGREMAVKIERLTGIPVAAWTLSGHDRTPTPRPEHSQETAA